MRAARYYGREDVRFDEVPEPVGGPGQVKLRVRYAGICGSDLHEYYSGPLFTPAHAPHPFTGVQNPVILGHELCGEVVDVGDGVDGFDAGDLVAVSPTQSCGHCSWCRAGDRVLCEAKAIHGYSRAGGGLAEYTVVAADMAFRLPPGIDAFRGALVEPMTVGRNAARRTRTAAGQTVAVHGAGPIGLGALFALRALDVRSIAFDPSPYRRAIVAGLGFEHVYDPTATDAVETVRELTGGRGADASVDAAGVPATLNAALESTYLDGEVVFVAITTQPVVLDMNRFRRFAVHLTSTGSQTPDAFHEVIGWMAEDRYPVEGWTETISFDDLVREGFEPLHAQEKMKVVVDLATAARPAAG